MPTHDVLLHELALFGTVSIEQLIMQPINSFDLEPMSAVMRQPAWYVMCHINSEECLNKVVEPF
jgi:hypothetical protein